MAASPIEDLSWKQLNSHAFNRIIRPMVSEKRKIMLVDDNIISMMVTADVLSAHGYTVVQTTSPNGCVAKLDYEAPDILLVDVKMPRLAFDDLIRSISLRRTIPRSSSCFSRAAIRERWSSSAWRRIFTATFAKRWIPQGFRSTSTIFSKLTSC